MEIKIGGFYLARVDQVHPPKPNVTRHVEVLRAVDNGRWEVVNTHTPTERYVVTDAQLTPESLEMRASREQAWARSGRPA